MEIAFSPRTLENFDRFVELPMKANWLNIRPMIAGNVDDNRREVSNSFVPVVIGFSSFLRILEKINFFPHDFTNNYLTLISRDYSGLMEFISPSRENKIIIEFF